MKFPGLFLAAVAALALCVCGSLVPVGAAALARTSDFVSVCDHSREVNDEIQAAIRLIRGEYVPCDDITAAMLALIEALDTLDIPEFARVVALNAGDFTALSGLKRLDLGTLLGPEAGSDPPDLPVGVFDGISSVTELSLTSNGLTALSSGS
ncbi:MAG: hypothetical protein OXH76_05720 [Boseongicola sp.]|nr:hypothetical protein [Boseongicola sp.]